MTHQPDQAPDYCRVEERGPREFALIENATGGLLWSFLRRSVAERERDIINTKHRKQGAT